MGEAPDRARGITYAREAFKKSYFDTMGIILVTAGFNTDCLH
jgi:hypothetical protein